MRKEGTPGCLLGRPAGKWLAAFLLAALVAGILSPVLAQAQVIIPDTSPGASGAVDAAGKLSALFGEVVKWILLASGGVIVIVLGVIGLRLIWGRDARTRAETMDWLFYVVIGAGLIFGGTLITRMLVGLFAKLS